MLPKVMPITRHSLALGQLPSPCFLLSLPPSLWPHLHSIFSDRFSPDHSCRDPQHTSNSVPVPFSPTMRCT